MSHFLNCPIAVMTVSYPSVAHSHVRTTIPTMYTMSCVVNTMRFRIIYPTGIMIPTTTATMAASVVGFLTAYIFLIASVIRLVSAEQIARRNIAICAVIFIPSFID